MKRIVLSLAAVAAACWMASSVVGDNKPCAKTPMSKCDAMGKRIKEGQMRAEIVRFESDFAAMRKAAEKIAADQRAEFARDPWHYGLLGDQKQRVERAAEEGADSLCFDVNSFIRDEKAAVALGKAFFWDMHVGSDGQTACASCHHTAGAENRPVSWGVALRMGAAPKVDGPLLTDAEPSEELTLQKVLQSYERQWGKMADFKDLLGQLAAKALSSGLTEVVASYDNMVKADALEFLKELNQLPEEAPALTQQRAAELRSMLVKVGTDPVEDPKPAQSKLTQPEKDRIIDYIQIAVDLVKYLNGEELNDETTFKPRGLSKLFIGRGAYEMKAHAERQTTGRNAPTVINAAFSDRLFHDGRAVSVFNGYDPLGDDAGPDGVGKWRLGSDGRLHRALIRIPQSALASQATAPLLNATEMSWFGRQYHHVARKLLSAKPLADQKVSSQDSVLGELANPNGIGLKKTYRELIEAAFHRQWISDALIGPVKERDALLDEDLRLTQIEANFSLFWGLAIQAYERTLISDQSPFDTTMSAVAKGDEPPATGGMSEEARKGLKVFEDHACADCHRLPEFAGGTFATVFGPMLEFEGPFDAVDRDETNGFTDWLTAREGDKVPNEAIEIMEFRRNLGFRFYDNGYYNIGVTSDDRNAESFDAGNGGEIRGIAGLGKQTLLLSARGSFGAGFPGAVLMREPPLSFSLARRHNDAKSGAIGAFRTPTLRNVALTGPYFHDGKTATTSAVLDHYDNPKFEDNRFIHPELLIDPETGRRPTALSRADQQLVLQLFESLTDPRVAAHIGAFERPQLKVPESREVDPKTGRTDPAHMKDVTTK